MLLKQALVDRERFSYLSGQEPRSPKCGKRPVSGFFEEELWFDINNKIQNTNQSSSWDQQLEKSCDPYREKIKKAIEHTLIIKPSSNVEDSTFLTCIADSSLARKFMPDFIQLSLLGHTRKPALKFRCEVENGSGCGTSMLDHKESTVIFKIKTPACAGDQVKQLTTQIAHEA